LTENLERRQRLHGESTESERDDKRVTALMYWGITNARAWGEGLYTPTLRKHFLPR